MRIACSLLILAILCQAPAHAQWAVIDPTNLVQNIEQVRQTIQQIQQIKAQVETTQKQLDSLTGDRGMRNLMTDTNRDYIPRDWRETLDGMGPQGRETERMIEDLRRNIGSIGATDLPNVPEGISGSLEASAQRDLAAWGRAATLYNRSNDRFAELERLGDALNTATDTKAVMDLMARLQIENNMLLNEMLRVQAEIAATDRQKSLFHDQRVQNEHAKAMSGF